MGLAGYVKFNILTNAYYNYLKDKKRDYKVKKLFKIL
jgi:hypothetical protein